jgi:predicted nucleic acid-binding Zn ribbon protein
MPTYEYRCNACGCEACNEPKLEKLISRTAFQLKGGGWYKDLYASTKPESSTKDSSTTSTTPSTTPAAAAPAASSSSSDSSSSSGTSSTPAAAAPSTPKPSSTP